MEDEHEQLLLAGSKAGELVKLVHELLVSDLTVEPTPEDADLERAKLSAIKNLLDLYQEESYLLDAFWESIISPAVTSLRRFARQFKQDTKLTYSPDRVDRLSSMIYQCIKCRGYKTIVRFFPHEVSDLTVALTFAEHDNSPVQVPSLWCLRYITLLWLGLLCMIPFDLAKFETTGDAVATRLQAIGSKNLTRAGLERESAALLLARLYARRDCTHLIQPFIEKTVQSLQSDPNIFETLGQIRAVLHMLSSTEFSDSFLKSGDIDRVVELLSESSQLMDNALVRKYRLKLITRQICRLLPAKMSTRRGKVL